MFVAPPLYCRTSRSLSSSTQTSPYAPFPVVQRPHLLSVWPLAPSHAPLRMTQTSPDPSRFPIITVSSSELLTPGQSSALPLPLETLHAILTASSSTFGQLDVNTLQEGRGDPIGPILTILSLQKVDAEPRAIVVADVHASGRFRLSGEPVADQGLLLWGKTVRVQDEKAWEFGERQAIAEREWEAWQLCLQVDETERKLAKRKSQLEKGEIGRLKRELVVCAPREYDRELQENEWTVTPLTVRDTWQDRAEKFAFGILRALNADDCTVHGALRMLNTEKRLALCISVLEEKRKQLLAKVAIQSAFENKYS